MSILLAEPGPDLSPEEVVRILVEAMRQNSELGEDRGIAIVYDFASPDNKEVTGPLPRFTKMVQHPMYAPLSHCTQVHYTPMQIGRVQAQQHVMVVTPDDELAGFMFVLRKQPAPPCKGWWMTDSVIRMF